MLWKRRLEQHLRALLSRVAPFVNLIVRVLPISRECAISINDAQAGWGGTETRVLAPSVAITYHDVRQLNHIRPNPQNANLLVNVFSLEKHWVARTDVEICFPVRRTMVKVLIGDIFESRAHALVNTVNTVGNCIGVPEAVPGYVRGLCSPM